MSNEQQGLDGVAAVISTKIRSALSPLVFELENESHRHSGPATDSHFKLTVVCEQFAELNRVKRHQQIYGILAEELQGPVHALALHLYSPQEWEETKGEVPGSPDCRGGSKAAQGQ
jgi:BolA protein